MNTVPTPDAIREAFHATEQPELDPIKFTHDTILESLGYERHGSGWAIIIAEPLKWRKLAEAPPEHEGHNVIVGGGKKSPMEMVLGTQGDHRTHYLLMSDLPPVPHETEDHDGFDAYWKANRIPYCNEEHARTIWQARGKEQP